MMLSKFVLPFLAIAIASSAKATSFDIFVEEIPVTCDGTPADIMGPAEMNFFCSTFVSIHNSENVIGSSDGIVLNNATVAEQESHIDTIRANLRSNSPPNVQSGWNSNTYSNLMTLILKGGCTRCRRSLVETSPTIREDFSIDFTNALRASNFTYFHSDTFNCIVGGPIVTNVLAAE